MMRIKLVRGLFAGVMPVLAASMAACASAATPVLLVANAGDAGRSVEGYISFFDPKTSELLAKVPNGGAMAHELIVSLDGKYAFAPIYGTGNVGTEGIDGSTISVIDIGARKVVDHIDLGHGARPHFGVANAKDGMIYITAELDQTVLILDPKSRRIVGSIPTGQPESHNVAVSQDGLRAYTSNVFVGTVSVLDVKNRKVSEIIRIADASPEKPNRTPADWRVQRVVLSNDDKFVFTCDWATSELVAINTATNRIEHRVPMESACYGLTPTPDGSRLLLSNYRTAKVSVVNLHTFKVEKIIAVPAAPQEILLSPDGTTGYVSCSTEKKVAVIRLSDWTVTNVISTGVWPDGLAWGGLDLRASAKR